MIQISMEFDASFAHLENLSEQNTFRFQFISIFHFMRSKWKDIKWIMYDVA